MKIILVHYRYYESSGPEKYLFNIKLLLEQNRHTVIPFSINYEKNKESKYSKYFVNSVVSDFHFNNAKIPIIKKIKIIIKSFYNKEVYKNLSKLIIDEKPDIVYVLQYGIKLSTSVFDACKKNKIPVVLRLSDYSLICAKNILFRDGNVCRDCLNGYYHGVKNRCVHNSILQSFVYFCVQKFNQIRKFEKKIDRIIAPSDFTIKLLKESKQFNNNKFEKVPTFHTIVNTDYILKYEQNQNINLCYWGRIDEDKGIDILIDAIKLLKDSGTVVYLKIIGDCNSDFAKRQIERAKELGLNNIHFTGYIPNVEIVKEIYDFHFSVIPSKWYDNMPNSLIESCSIGMPVIVSDHGSLSELIKDGFNGFKFKANEPDKLANKILSLTNISNDEYIEISKNSKKWILDYCNPNKHYKSLIQIFNSIINESDCK